jgi:hypothetical protein
MEQHIPMEKDVLRKWLKAETSKTTDCIRCGKENPVPVQ